ncbi:hypothetical protein V1477_007697 [Vespula maculifrons]|uniref:Uncharacterized protein n=1 Tax=Vespula maculifrons TaxID=7453 RepID=A0ABD2CFM6_VESMC
MENFCRVTSLSNILAWSKVWTLRRHGSSLMKLRKTLLASYGSPLMKLKKSLSINLFSRITVILQSGVVCLSCRSGLEFQYGSEWCHQLLQSGLDCDRIYYRIDRNLYLCYFVRNKYSAILIVSYGYHDNASAEAGAAKSGIGN